MEGGQGYGLMAGWKVIPKVLSNNDLLLAICKLGSSGEGPVLYKGLRSRNFISRVWGVREERLSSSHEGHPASFQPWDP